MSLAKEQTCKGCGLSVQLGYPQCPRCKMPLTVTRAPLASATDNTPGQGGTALQSESSPNWLWIAGAVLIVGIAIVILSGGSSSDDKTEAAIQIDLDDDADDSPSEDNRRAVAKPRVVETPAEASDTDAMDDQRAVIAELESLLNQSRLWVTLSVLASSESTLSIVSASCEDAAMKSTIRKSAAKLKAVALTEVQCFAKHGELLFSQQL